MEKFKIHVCAFTIIWSVMVFGQSNLQQIYTESKKAYDLGDYVTFLDKMLQANKIRSNHPTLLYNLAAAYALNGKKEKSVNTLKRVVWMDATLPFQNDGDFQGLTNFLPYMELINEVKDLNKIISKGRKAFEINDKSIHPEGVAYSEKQGKFYIGSVRQRKILELDKDRAVKEFANVESLNAIMGLKVDDQNGLLWACSTPIPEMVGDHEGKVAQVLCFDLKTGKLLESYSAPHENAWLGDLTISVDGAIYVSNSNAENPVVYTVKKGKEELEVLFKAPNLISLQGIDLNTEGTKLFIADYREGIFSYDFEKKKLSAIKYSLHHPLKGIDGLYYHNGSLIAIHNGLKPFRIMNYQLSDAEDEIISFAFIEKALPEMNEPTLGVMVGDELFYVANSPWNAYNDDKKLKLEEVAIPLIRKVDVSSILKRKSE
ncbi:hypothetical protein HME9304_00954 [Flagellimonas maritima]|uniref:SMP-30/Gluconolactonase/LRE-like region domain-containing protein n=1 Tax=Flagellimonas maritima TaxID=1383885 RepID=A0A2Z4LQ45_9FLAO|nr:hypothetical protein [Allomuricauda aurantiaca]AWX43955.1 hypothetical protein HME9304_00954 [Allomuricauda aurantiaca]